MLQFRCQSLMLGLLLLEQGSSLQASEATIFRGKEISIPLSDFSIGELTSINALLIKVDGAVVNDFSRLTRDMLYIAPPFPEQTRSVQVTITGTESDIAYEHTFRRPDEGEVFDTVEATHEVDVTSNGVFRLKPTPRQDPFDSTDIDARFHGRMSVNATRGNWSFGLENAWQGVSDENQTLRPDGSRLDLERGTASINYKNSEFSLGLNVGDVQVGGSNSLVTYGMQSRGASLSFAGMDGRMRASVAQIYGTDIRGLTGGVLATDTDNYRRSLELEADILKSKNLNITLTSSFFSAKRPAQFGFRIGHVPEGESNNVKGIGLRIQAFEQALSLDGEIAWAKYDNPQALNQFNIVPGALAAGETEDSAKHVRAAWQGWSGTLGNTSASLSLHADYKKNGALYNALQAGVQADMDKRELGANMQLGLFSLQGTFVKLENNVDNIAGILKTRRKQLELASQLDFSSLKFSDSEGFSAVKLLPDSLDVSYRQDRETTLNADIVIFHSSLNGSELPDTKEENWNIALSWNWTNGATSISYTDTFYDARQQGRETADRKNKVWTFSQSFFGEKWDIEGHLTSSKDENLDISSRSQDQQIDWGGRFGLRLKNWPVISLSYDQGYAKSEDFVFLETTRNRTKRFDLSLEFSPFISMWWEGENPPRVTMNFQHSEGRVLSSFFDDRTKQSAFTINLAKRF